MIHVFHGFLGSPKDFHFLPKRDDLIIHNLLQRKEHPPVINENDTLVGYSMGGRFCLELAAQVNFKIKRLVLINSHPGLSSEKEKVLRKTWEDDIESKIISPDFIAFWNKLEIFKFDAPLEEMNLDLLQEHRDLFNELRLSKQKDYLPDLMKHKNNVLFIIGKNDPKYLNISQSILIPNGIYCRFINGGHRLFQHPTELTNSLTAEGVL